MHKTRNTGTGNARNGGNVIFRGMSPNIPGNIAKHSGECPQTFREMSPNIPGNVLKHSGECPQTFGGMSSNIPGDVAKHSGECPQTFRYIIVVDTGDHELYLFVEEPLLLNSRKRKSSPKLLDKKQEHFKLILIMNVKIS